MTDRTPMAKTAVDIYDRDGERQMLEHIRLNQDSRPEEAGDQSLTVLRDHTAVQISSQTYTFLWTSWEPNLFGLRAVSQREIRKIFLPAPARLETISREDDGPFPNTGHFMRQMLKLLEEKVHMDQGTENTTSANDPVLAPEDAITLVPALLTKARHSAGAFRDSDWLFQTVCDIGTIFSRDTLRDLDPQDLKKLEDATRKAMRKSLTE